MPVELEVINRYYQAGEAVRELYRQGQTQRIDEIDSLVLEKKKSVILYDSECLWNNFINVST